MLPMSVVPLFQQKVTFCSPFVGAETVKFHCTDALHCVVFTLKSCIVGPYMDCVSSTPAVEPVGFASAWVPCQRGNASEGRPERTLRRIRMQTARATHLPWYTFSTTVYYGLLKEKGFMERTSSNTQPQNELWAHLNARYFVFSSCWLEEGFSAVVSVPR